MAFCEKLSKREGKTHRLPTEAEFEYACRAGSKARYYFGNDADALGDCAWFANNSGDETQSSSDGSDRVARGGSWIEGEAVCTAASRTSRGPGDSRIFVGFRLLAVPMDK